MLDAILRWLGEGGRSIVPLGTLEPGERVAVRARVEAIQPAFPAPFSGRPAVLAQVHKFRTEHRRGLLAGGIQRIDEATITLGARFALRGRTGAVYVDPGEGDLRLVGPREKIHDDEHYRAQVRTTLEPALRESLDAVFPKAPNARVRETILADQCVAYVSGRVDVLEGERPLVRSGYRGGGPALQIVPDGEMRIIVDGH